MAKCLRVGGAFWAMFGSAWMEPSNVGPNEPMARDETYSMSVADAIREPPEAPSTTGGSFPEGGAGRAWYAWGRLSALCHLAWHAAMASCLDVAFWQVNAFGVRWL